MSLAIAAAWGALVLAACRRPALPDRVRALRRPAAVPRRWSPDARARRLLPALGAALAALVVLPPVAPLVLVGGWAVPVAGERRRARNRVEALRRSLPEVIDLLALAVGAGLTVPQAVAAVGARHDGPVGAALARAAEETARGRRCGDALDGVAAALGAAARPLLAALAASDRYGAPLGEALARLAADARADHRRRAEEAARRVPVKLLFPLVLCVLPAFALLTVAPLLAGALGSLRL